MWMSFGVHRQAEVSETLLQGLFPAPEGQSPELQKLNGWEHPDPKAEVDVPEVRVDPVAAGTPHAPVVEDGYRFILHGDAFFGEARVLLVAEDHGSRAQVNIDLVERDPFVGIRIAAEGIQEEIAAAPAQPPLLLWPGPRSR
jgi:hypothetical protein